MIHLCLDTSSTTSIALVKDGQVLARAHGDSPRHHVEAITPLLRRVLTEAGLPTDLARHQEDLAPEKRLEAVLVGTGPAPFTGLRAGLVSARVLAAAVGVPVWGVPSLAVLARAALDRLPPERSVFAVSDARRRELHWGHFTAEGPDDVALVGRLEVGSPAQLANQMRASSALVVVEEALPAHARDAIDTALLGPLEALDPAVMVRIVGARLARGDRASLGTEPLYLRRPDIQGRAPERM
ncbi:tRNA (adenosine(37)-N6)-threonylcarbamoyltransferase complex dimerization subunit type 1 TsaB [Schaalia sp. 19OD2882]|uniref:tRNA (adenosine(37)-N6)-threonylcarbamoyltransferase complex dimerization subunit type 1 TsaB n=1 Tax=Schaalia sp. 19OD2882 TaxID=2794089 RepID=UPI001C1EA945|nr:tRNA (adenosine(37)-N6)-threonylcarbamoyltransferase complex dimerization subunit type 1 TsaB [Schaalia sp. 19OD2882]QWW19218.1 tRNA (adenosine(37)-N6)-threonylcarbamoyltransferase complex dimerization subunit type 1 TsaB [Schaalia sp. 19OD2882]